MKIKSSKSSYFFHELPITTSMWKKLELSDLEKKGFIQPVPPAILFYRTLADRLNRLPEQKVPPAKPGILRVFALMNRIFHSLLDAYFDSQYPLLEEQVLAAGNLSLSSGSLSQVISRFVELYPPSAAGTGQTLTTSRRYLAEDDQKSSRKRRVVRESLLLYLAMENPALNALRPLFDDGLLVSRSPFKKVSTVLDSQLGKGPPCAPFELPILELLRAPRRACPDSLTGQMSYIRENWTAILAPELLEEIASAFDTISEEERTRGVGPGPPLVLEFSRKKEPAAGAPGYEYPEPERFSPDRSWMPDVVLIAKMVYVWMDQLSRKYGRAINRLDEIPDAELDTLASWGFTGLWLIGLWERSPASRTIKQYCGNPEAIASAYSLYDYVIAEDLGGTPALDNLRHRAAMRGIRLASDMVPNHTGIDSRWTREHPDWFVQVDYPPYPGYRFEGPDLSSCGDISLRIEDGYWSKTDAAVVFQHVDKWSGRVRYIYHGNDGTSTPWNDTAQLNYLLPEVREAVIQTILHVARSFPIIRFDAAMTLAKKHYQRLWFPQPGLGGGIPSRAEHALSRTRFDELFPLEFWREVVDRVAAEAPDTLLLAEAFWLMEGYFVRTLGMHRVYNSAFMNMLKMEENAKYRQTIKNVLAFNPEILQRFVNFMNNPDERTAVDQFGKEGKYFGAALLMVTMPGLPMFGHGQVEGFTEKYGMEYRRAYWQEEIDHHLVHLHERLIFPLMKKRHLFSGAENFALYDFNSGETVDENVFAYSNARGDDRALIIYHNCFAATAGWVRDSSPRTTKDASEESRTLRTTLGEALGINHDGRYYYRFRDSLTGLEYLRHGRELVEKGLFLKLEAYECHAFIDFREIWDDDYGTWGKLCRDLDGRPVTCLDEEFRRIRYSGTIDALTRLFTHLSNLLPIIFDPATPQSKRKEAGLALSEPLAEFLSMLRTEACLDIGIEGLTDDILQDLESLAETARHKSRGKGAKAAREALLASLGPTRNYDNRLLLVLYLVLHRLAGTLGSNFIRHPERIMVEFALNRTIEDSFRNSATTTPGFEPSTAGGRANLLLGILLVHHAFFLEEPEPGKESQLELLFEAPAVREFLLVHLSDDIEWFNKERFEELMQALLLAGFATLLERGKTIAEACEESIRMNEALQYFYRRAEQTHYRTTLLLGNHA